MTRTHKHLHGHASTSITKAVAICCAQMRPVVAQQWSKSTRGTGSQA
ncbi:MAG: hypothetical protein WC661_08420 [Opitutaceae bacterium]